MKVFWGFIVFALISSFTGCLSLLGEGTNQTAARQTAQGSAQTQGVVESDADKFQRILSEDMAKLPRGEDGKVTTSGLEEGLHPTSVARLGEIKSSMLEEFARPYYFKIRALYKGDDARAERVIVQYLEEPRNPTAAEIAMAGRMNYDPNTYGLMRYDTIVPRLPSEANSTATFYFLVIKIKVSGREAMEAVAFAIGEIEGPHFNPANFVLKSEMHFVTVSDAHYPTKADAMMEYYGVQTGGSSAGAFDPAIYPSIDLFDARIAMDRKDLGDERTLPRVPTKYVSEVVFKGQSSTTITVSTPDGLNTERMNFLGRAGVAEGETIRIYYTISKDPLEVWDVQALEHL